MTPLLVQRIALGVVFISLIMLLLMGYLLWLQRRAVAAQDRPRGNGWPRNALGAIRCPSNPRFADCKALPNYHSSTSTHQE
ncbi:MAG: hypothetical protein F9K25_19180 [Candidatus Contendobacter sp.]|nr:MAG: hypothetical protein F9K25_19180 [Candidatus Contendobacter sp.]